MTEKAVLDYMIEVEKVRPLGQFNYAAKATISSRVDISTFATKPPIGEVWGETEADAVAKVRKAMEEWGKSVGASVSAM